MDMAHANNDTPEVRLPTTPRGFCKFMEEVWSMDCEPAPDGGMLLFGSPLYDEWHDAIETAKRCGMNRTGGTKRFGEDVDVYRWPDGQGVWIAKDGAGCSDDLNKFSPRIRRH